MDSKKQKKYLNRLAKISQKYLKELKKIEVEVDGVVKDYFKKIDQKKIEQVLAKIKKT